jgi:acetyl-CoA carboxylase biotin carboxyl carrier protein
MARTQVPCPLPGTFYRRPSPDQPPFKNEGDAVAVGDVIGLIEVMKTFNEITAETAGTLAVFLVEDDEAVMAGQPLYELDV